MQETSKSKIIIDGNDAHTFQVIDNEICILLTNVIDHHDKSWLLFHTQDQILLKNLIILIEDDVDYLHWFLDKGFYIDMTDSYIGPIALKCLLEKINRYPILNPNTKLKMNLNYCGNSFEYEIQTRAEYELAQLLV